jgi:hypothetical protein
MQQTIIDWANDQFLQPIGAVDQKFALVRVCSQPDCFRCFGQYGRRDVLEAAHIRRDRCGVQDHQQFGDDRGGS